MHNNISLLVAEKIVKIICAALLGEKKLITSADIASLCSSLFKGAKEQYSEFHTRIEIEHIVVDTAEMIDSILNCTSLEEESRRAIIHCISDSIECTELSAKAIVNLHSDSKALAKVLFQNCKGLQHMSQKEEEIIVKCCNFIATIVVSSLATHSGEFIALNYNEIYKRFEDLHVSLSREMKQYISDLISPTKSVQNFQTQYMEVILQNHNHVELFTSKIDNHFTKHYRLDAAYIELALRQDAEGTRNVSIENLLNHGKRWIITGEAGCGKTTLLQWLALSAVANSNNPNHVLYDYIPVVVTLRNIKDWGHLGIKQAIEHELRASDISIPAGYLRSLSATGKGLLLLVDGLDEIDETNRCVVLHWLESIISTRDEWVKSKIQDRDKRAKETGEKFAENSPQVQKILKERYENRLIIVLSSRPMMSGNIDTSLNLLGIKEASVLPMAYRDVCTFIDYWHNAISFNRNLDQETIIDTADDLKEKVGKYESLAKLAQNPLLCAMICALHFRQKGILPTNRLELYDACSQMLLNERDQLRVIRFEKYQEIGKFEYEDKRRILGDLALWMMQCNGSLQIDYDDALEHLKSKLTFMKSVNGYNNEQAVAVSKLLLDYFIERGGILRWIETKKIGFIHKTFQEYFAAYQIYLESSWSLIISESCATDVNWRETILLSLAFSSKENAEKVIRYYLGKSGNTTYRDVSPESNYNDQLFYRILAINCAAMARELEPKTVALIEKETLSIIPPNDQNQMDGLSSCGNLVVPLLGYNSSYNEKNNYSCAYVLLQVRTSQSLSQLTQYLDCKSRSVYNCLNSFWKYLAYDTVLNSNIIPSYVQAIINHDVVISNGQAQVTKDGIIHFENVAPFSTLDKNDNNSYYLADVMVNRLRRKLSSLKCLRIDNYWFKTPRKEHAILKLLNLFSIAKNICEIQVSYDGEDSREEVEIFCKEIGKFRSLRKLKICDLTIESKKHFEHSLQKLNISDLHLSMRYDKPQNKC